MFVLTCLCKRGPLTRLALLSAHYRQPLDFSRDGLDQAKKQLDRWYRLTEGVEATEEDIPEDFLEALRDDLNTPKAIAVLNKLAKENRVVELKAAANLFGVLQDGDWFRRNAFEVKFGMSVRDEVIYGPDSIQRKIDERAEAKKRKDFVTADRIRDELAAQGVILKDGPDGTTWERK